jgi:hypothetical protein
MTTETKTPSAYLHALESLTEKIEALRRESATLSDSLDALLARDDIAEAEQLRQAAELDLRLRLAPRRIAAAQARLETLTNEADAFADQRRQELGKLARETANEVRKRAAAELLPACSGDLELAGSLAGELPRVQEAEARAHVDLGAGKLPSRLRVLIDTERIVLEEAARLTESAPATEPERTEQAA